MTFESFHKVFIPTKECMLMGGEDAITSFADTPKNKDPEKHLVSVSEATLEALTHSENQTEQYRGGINYAQQKERAAEVLRFLNERLPMGFEVNKPYHVGNNLYVQVTNKEEKDVAKLGSELEIVCKYEGERTHFRRQGLNATLAKFARINPNIRRQGIVNIEHDDLYDELSSRMHQNRNQDRRKVELSMFSDHLENTYPNQYLVLTRASGNAEPLIGYVCGKVHWRGKGNQRTRFVMDDLAVNLMTRDELMRQHLLESRNGGGLRPRNLEQALYMHALQQEHVSLIFVTGGAGTGKTVVGYGSALSQAIPRIKSDSRAIQEGARSADKEDLELKEKELERARFRELFLVKSRELIGGRERDIGFKPGTERDKLAGGLESYFSAHDSLGLPYSFARLEEGAPSDGQSGKGKGRRIEDSSFVLPAHPLIRIQDYAQWRGVTRENAVVFLDEAQNFTPQEMKHLLQRMGGGSLYVVSGDYDDQIDARSLHATYNGLFAGIKHFHGQPYVAVINLEENQRHMAAEHAGNMRIY